MQRSSFEYDIGKRCCLHCPVCPQCGEQNYEDAVSCPSCDGYKTQRAHICSSCRARLAKKFVNLIDGLCPEEIEQLDDWLDGASVTWAHRFA